MFKTSKLNNRCLLLLVAVLCSVVLLMLTVNSITTSPSTSVISDSSFASWLQTAQRQVLSMRNHTPVKKPPRAAPEASINKLVTTSAPRHISKPPLYPPGFRLNNLDNFTFAINNDVCGDEPVDVVMIVTSNTRHPSHRDAIRSALPAETLREIRMRRVFLMAQLPKFPDPAQYDLHVARQHAENHEHGDIVSGMFADTYRNLTYKHLMGLHWASTYCPQASYILKMDHDIAVDVFQLRERLSTAPRAMSVVGAVFAGSGPIRDTASKWYVPASEFPSNSYPAYMSGWMYAVTPDAAAALVAAARKEPFFWVDDVFVTGVVREKHLPKIKMLDMDRMWGQPDDTGNSASIFTMDIDCIYQCSAEAESSTGRCDTLVGPAWENRLVLRLFMKQAEYCFRQRCARRQHMPDVCRGATSQRRFGMPSSAADLGDVKER